MIDFSKSEDRVVAADTLRAGAKGEFWAIMLQVLDQNISHIEREMASEDMSEMDATEYKVQMEVWKGRKRDLLKLKLLPETLIVELEDPDQTEPTFDPYDNGEDPEPSQ